MGSITCVLCLIAAAERVRGVHVRGGHATVSAVGRWSEPLLPRLQQPMGWPLRSSSR